MWVYNYAGWKLGGRRGRRPNFKPRLGDWVCCITCRVRLNITDNLWAFCATLNKVLAWQCSWGVFYCQCICAYDYISYYDDVESWAKLSSWRSAKSSLSHVDRSKKTQHIAHWFCADLTLGQRRRRWPNVKSTPGQCVVFAGYYWREISIDFYQRIFHACSLP